MAVLWKASSRQRSKESHAELFVLVCTVIGSGIWVSDRGVTVVAKVLYSGVPMPKVPPAGSSPAACSHLQARKYTRQPLALPLVVAIVLKSTYSQTSGSFT